METLTKVNIDKKIRRSATVKISIVGTITLLGLALSVYSLFTGKILFFLWYFVAFILGLSYVVIRINAIFPSYIALEDGRLIMSIWKNGILPYQIPEKPNFLSDFIPEKIKKDEIDLNDISEIYIGSKRFLSRHLDDDKYPEILKSIGEDRHFESVIRRMDFLLVVAKDGETCFMSVTDFDIRGLSEIIDEIERNCAGVKIFVGIPKLRRIIETIKKA